MGLNTLDTVARQAAGTAKNLADGAEARLRRETSITGWANRLVSGGAKTAAAPLRKGREEGVYILSEREAREGRQPSGRPFVTPDGYVRKSPVQELAVAPGYRRRLICRAALYAAETAVALVALYALVRFGVIGI